MWALFILAMLYTGAIQWNKVIIRCSKGEKKVLVLKLLSTWMSHLGCLVLKLFDIFFPLDVIFGAILTNMTIYPSSNQSRNPQHDC